MMSRLRALGSGPYRAGELRDLGIYGGAAGIWVDKAHTAQPDAPQGVTVSVLHTGEHYPDDLSDSGLIYHYPVTDRPASRDRNEVDATKAAKLLRLPIFVVLPHEHDEALRDVKIGWVDDWDDTAKEFLLIFSQTPPEHDPSPAQESPFNLTDDQPAGRRTGALSRPNQQRFRFDVLKAYGPQCAVCSVNRVELLVAAHVCPKSEKGCDDWRNGIVLCWTHHTAFDRGLFGFEPETLAVLLKSDCNAAELGITTARFRTGAARPHAEALRHHLRSWELVKEAR
jgi:hypothetical protein